MNKENAFQPIKLPETNLIVRKGYYIGKIINAKVQSRDDRCDLKVEFRVIKGKCEGFHLMTVIRDIYRRNYRLSYLCKAAGIGGKLNDPKELIGKIVKLRVVPNHRTYMGRTYLDHKITRFHPMDRPSS
ncbi:DUF669 domain-containing protein [bacterium]|nr:DUF669 domain-containing protein [bacterium]